MKSMEPGTRARSKCDDEAMILFKANSWFFPDYKARLCLGVFVSSAGLRFPPNLLLAYNPILQLIFQFHNTNINCANADAFAGLPEVNPNARTVTSSCLLRMPPAVCTSDPSGCIFHDEQLKQAG